jgi:hypothetical protein
MQTFAMKSALVCPPALLRDWRRRTCSLSRAVGPPPGRRRLPQHSIQLDARAGKSKGTLVDFRTVHPSCMFTARTRSDCSYFRLGRPAHGIIRNRDQGYRFRILHRPSRSISFTFDVFRFAFRGLTPCPLDQPGRAI